MILKNQIRQLSELVQIVKLIQLELWLGEIMHIGIPALFRAWHLPGAHTRYMSEPTGIHIRKKTYFLLQVQHGTQNIFSDYKIIYCRKPGK